MDGFMKIGKRIHYFKKEKGGWLAGPPNCRIGVSVYSKQSYLSLRAAGQLHAAPIARLSNGHLSLVHGIHRFTAEHLVPEKSMTCVRTPLDRCPLDRFLDS